MGYALDNSLECLKCDNTTNIYQIWQNGPLNKSIFSVTSKSATQFGFTYPTFTCSTLTGTIYPTVNTNNKCLAYNQVGNDGYCARCKIGYTSKVY